MRKDIVLVSLILAVAIIMSAWILRENYEIVTSSDSGYRAFVLNKATGEVSFYKYRSDGAGKHYLLKISDVMVPK